MPISENELAKARSRSQKRQPWKLNQKDQSASKRSVSENMKYAEHFTFETSANRNHNPDKKRVSYGAVNESKSKDLLQLQKIKQTVKA